MDQSEHVITLIAIALFAGVLGGLVSYYGLMNNRRASGASDAAEEPTPVDPNAGPPVIRGVAAALVTPLFLRAVSSDLLTIEGDEAAMKYFLFGATCLLAAISSRAFIGSVSKTVLKAAEEAGRSAGKQAAKQVTAPIEEKSEQVSADLQSLRESETATVADLKRLSMMRSGPRESLAPLQPADGRAPRTTDPWESDPHKGQFGGSDESKGWRLSATVTPLPNSRVFCTVVLTVTAPPGATPKDDTVVFHLHPTFRPDTYEETLVDGRASLEIVAGGAFTAGAVADGGDVRLELDLADPVKVSAPAEFQAN